MSLKRAHDLSTLEVEQNQQADKMCAVSARAGIAGLSRSCFADADMNFYRLAERDSPGPSSFTCSCTDKVY